MNAYRAPKPVETGLLQRCRHILGVGIAATTLSLLSAFAIAMVGIARAFGTSGGSALEVQKRVGSAMELAYNAAFFGSAGASIGLGMVAWALVTYARAKKSR